MPNPRDNKPETADYQVTVTRPTPNGPVTETHEHRNVNSLNWDDRYLRLHLHEDEGTLPVAMYAHAAVLDLQTIDSEQEEYDAVLRTILTPNTLRQVADRMERDGVQGVEPITVASIAAITTTDSDDDEQDDDGLTAEDKRRMGLVAPPRPAGHNPVA